MPKEEEMNPSEEGEKAPNAEKPEEQKPEEKDSQEDDSDGFVKDQDTVTVGKYNQAIRKQREIELEKRELEKQLALAKNSPKKEEKQDDDEEDFFKEDEEDSKKKDVDIEALVESKVKPVLERLNERDAEEKKNQRTAFFKKYPQYLDATKWQELLDEVDNSLNPHSKDGYYKQLIKAHRIISAEESYSDIDKKKKEMASDSASKGDGSQKAADRKSSEEERADRLTRKMPIGYEYKE